MKNAIPVIGPTTVVNPWLAVILKACLTCKNETKVNETKVNIYTAIKSYHKKYSSSAPGSIHKINWPKYR